MNDWFWTLLGWGMCIFLSLTGLGILSFLIQRGGQSTPHVTFACPVEELSKEEESHL